jgi:hypothetical protein
MEKKTSLSALPQTIINIIANMLDGKEVISMIICRRLRKSHHTVLYYFEKLFHEYILYARDDVRKTLSETARGRVVCNIIGNCVSIIKPNSNIQYYKGLIYLNNGDFKEEFSHFKIGTADGKVSTDDIMHIPDKIIILHASFVSKLRRILSNVNPEHRIITCDVPLEVYKFSDFMSFRSEKTSITGLIFNRASMYIDFMSWLKDPELCPVNCLQDFLDEKSGSKSNNRLKCLECISEYAQLVINAHKDTVHFA